MKSTKQKCSADGLTIFAGRQDVYEVLRNLNPRARNRDWLLLVARRCAGGQKSLDLARLKNSELRAVAWFAHLPGETGQADPEKRSALLKETYDKTNQFTEIFLDVFLREPDVAASLLSRLREYQKQKDQAVEDYLNHANKPLPINDSAAKKRIERARKMTCPPEEIRRAVARFAKRREGQRPPL